MQAQAEIIQLGESALSQLQQAYKDLNSAANWGIASSVTNGLLFVSKKYDLLENANQCIEDAKVNLGKIKDLLENDEVTKDLNISQRDFWEFDNMYSGYASMSGVVTDRINEARSQVKAYIEKLESLLNQIR